MKKIKKLKDLQIYKFTNLQICFKNLQIGFKNLNS